MDKNNVVSAEIVRQITRMVVEELQKQQRLERSTPIGVSNRHVHLDRADMDALFGPGSELTVKKCSASRGSMLRRRPSPSAGPKGSSAACACWAPARSDAGRDLHRRRLHAGGQAPGARVRSVEGYPGH